MGPLLRRLVPMICVTAAAGALTPQLHVAAAAADRDALTVSLLVSGTQLHHRVGDAWEALSNPDDITYAAGDIFVAFQNGVGSQGEPSTTGNRRSTIVEVRRDGDVVRQWDITGKCDGLTADLADERLIATVNEDGNSSLYTINLDSGRLDHYAYSRPLPSNGGTDAITVYRDRIIVSASAPGSTGGPPAPNAAYPALYAVTLEAAGDIAAVQPLFSDVATARVANRNAEDSGQRVTLMLTDPDSNAVVPAVSPRFAGSFMLNSQGDQEQIYASRLGNGDQRRDVLRLSQSVDDTVWATDEDGTLYATDSPNDRVVAVRGSFTRGEALVNVTPCDANSAPSTCPSSPPNYLGRLDLATGHVVRLETEGLDLQPAGLLFV